jgi:hypothetical protein
MALYAALCNSRYLYDFQKIKIIQIVENLQACLSWDWGEGRRRGKEGGEGQGEGRRRSQPSSIFAKAQRKHNSSLSEARDKLLAARDTSTVIALLSA